MNSRYGLLLKWTIRVALSVWIAVIFFHDIGGRGYHLMEFSDIVHGSAHRPFVTRALFPALVRAVARAIPDGFDATVEQSALGSKLLSSWYVRKELKWRPPFLREYLVSFLLSVLCLILFAMTAEAFWRTIYAPSKPHAYVFSTIALLGLPTCFRYFSYIYDFPTLLLFTSSLVLMAQRRWRWYFPVFALACINKETAILLIPIFALYFFACRATERRTYWGYICAQALLFLAIRGAIAWAFRMNPGSPFEFHCLDYNIRKLSLPWTIEEAMTWGIVLVLVFNDLRSKPWLARVAAGMLAPLLALCLFFGYLDELRDYYEVYVPVLALGAFSLCKLLGRDIRVVAPVNPAAVPRIRPSAA